MSDDRRAESAGELARTRGYLRLLVLAGLVGVPVSLAAFGFLALLHEALEVLDLECQGGGPAGRPRRVPGYCAWVCA